MSKKKKKNRYYATLDGKKKGKGHKKSMDKALRKAKTVQPSLSKKESKAMRKEMEKPFVVDKDYLRLRYKCNHADGNLSVADYRAKYPGKADAYTPMLQSMVDLFGEENVRVCAHCFEAVVNRNMVSLEDVKTAITTLYAAAGVVVANVRMKKDEIKEVNKSKDSLAKLQPIVDFMTEFEEKGSSNPKASDNVDLNSVGMTIDD